jgi:bacillithiol system protein YtxJ
MTWINLQTDEHLNHLKENSYTKPQIIFKHSTRCSISSVAKNRLERTIQPEELDFHYLDLIKYRQISAKISDDFNVYHESPQILVIKDGACVYDESHSAIDMKDIIEQALAA